MRAASIAGALLLAACGQEPRLVLSGESPLVGTFQSAAAEADVPAEVLAGIAWAETGLIDRPIAHDAEADGHVPHAYGVMGLPEEGPVRSVARAAELLGLDPDLVRHDALSNVRGAAAILRSLAPPDLGAHGSRDRWLDVVARYFDAGAAGDSLALDVRRTVARGLETQDDRGKSFVIPSFAALYPERAPDSVSKGLNAQYSGATWVAANSGNFTNASRTGADIDIIVIHTVQGSYAGAISWFQNPSSNVSAHYVVRRSDGAITQMVRHEDIGWHAGNWSYNQRSIGIEHEGWVSDANNYTQPMLQASADLSRWLCDTLGIPKDRNHVIGHVEVPSATHTDPGRYFPWTQYMDLIRGGGGMQPPPPPSGNGKLQGVVYVGTDTANRVPGAAITVMPGGQTTTGRAGDGYWSFNLPPGTYTVTARAPGYQDGTSTKSVSAGSDTWGSISVTPAPMMPDTGVLKGLIYDGTQPDTGTLLDGARVRLSNGASATVGGDGLYELTVAPGTYTITASKDGWVTASVERTVTAGMTRWGSIGLVPEMTMPANRAPEEPALESPIRGVTVRTVLPIFTVDGVRDPDGDAVQIQVEVFADEARTTRVSRGMVSASPRDRLVSWQHPQDDLPRGAQLYWRARASDAMAHSPWTELEAFKTPEDGNSPSVAADTPWVAMILAGVGTNGAPGTSRIVEPADGALIETSRPKIVAERASDPEADTLVYQFQIAADDLFDRIETTSTPVADEGGVGPSWVPGIDLAQGGRYYLRVRAADERVFGPWSAAILVEVSPDAETGAEEPSRPVDIGGKPMVMVKVLNTDDGCTTMRGRSSATPGFLLAFGAIFLARRRRAKMRECASARPSSASP